MSRITDFLNSIKIEDVLQSPASASDSKMLSELRKHDPPKTSEGLTNFLSNISLEYIGCKSENISEEASSDSDSGSDSDNDSSEESDNCTDSDNETKFDGDKFPEENAANDTNNGGRRSNDIIKKEALLTPFIDLVNSLAVPCNSNCCFRGECTDKLPMNIVGAERIKFFGPN